MELKFREASKVMDALAGKKGAYRFFNKLEGETQREMYNLLMEDEQRFLDKFMDVLAEGNPQAAKKMKEKEAQSQEKRKEKEEAAKVMKNNPEAFKEQKLGLIGATLSTIESVMWGLLMLPIFLLGLGSFILAVAVIIGTIFQSLGF